MKEKVFRLCACAVRCPNVKRPNARNAVKRSVLLEEYYSVRDSAALASQDFGRTALHGVPRCSSPSSGDTRTVHIQFLPSIRMHRHRSAPGIHALMLGENAAGAAGE